MISGAHIVVYSQDPEADRAFCRDVLGFPAVDAGQGWLIFGLPGAELAFHPADRNNLHELYLMCDDIQSVLATLARHRVACPPLFEERWGIRTRIPLPGGGEIGLYQPRHPVALRPPGT